MTEPRVLFYAVESTGPRLLHDSPCDSAWMEVYDRLELGTYSRLRSYPGARFLGLQEHLERARELQGVYNAVRARLSKTRQRDLAAKPVNCRQVMVRAYQRHLDRKLIEATVARIVISFLEAVDDGSGVEASGIAGAYLEAIGRAAAGGEP